MFIVKTPEMTVKHERIVEACLPILESVGFHITTTKSERRFLTAYQIWEYLQEINPEFAQELIKACGGNYRGKGAGANVGPAQKIGQALGNCPEKIETQYIATKFLMIHDIIPSSNEDCGIFRLAP